MLGTARTMALPRKTGSPFSGALAACESSGTRSCEAGHRKTGRFQWDASRGAIGAKPWSTWRLGTAMIRPALSPTHGESAYNHWLPDHPLFLFNQLEMFPVRHSARRNVLEPVVMRYKERKVRLYFRGDAASRYTGGTYGLEPATLPICLRWRRSRRGYQGIRAPSSRAPRRGSWAEPPFDNHRRGAVPVMPSSATMPFGSSFTPWPGQLHEDTGFAEGGGALVDDDVAPSW